MEEAVPGSSINGKETRPNVLPLEAEIDLHVSLQVAEELRMMMQTKPEVLVVDLGKVTYLDSCGLAVLIEAMQNVRAYGGKFVLAGVPESVQYIFEQAKLGLIFQTFSDVDTALAAK